VYVIRPSGVEVAVPPAGWVTPTSVRVWPLGSLSFASTCTTTGVRRGVVALSSTARGGLLTTTGAVGPVLVPVAFPAVTPALLGYSPGCWGTVARKVSVVDAPAATVRPLKVSVWPVTLGVPPVAEPATKLNPAGSVSVTATPVAAAVPVLATVTE
jgi:hypothetical protein